MVFEENFLRLTVAVRFQKLGTSKTLIFFLFFSVSHNNVVVTKQIYFSPTFFKSWACIPDNIAGVSLIILQVYWEVHSTASRDISIGKEKEIFSPVQ